MIIKVSTSWQTHEDITCALVVSRCYVVSFQAKENAERLGVRSAYRVAVPSIANRQGICEEDGEFVLYSLRNTRATLLFVGEWRKSEGCS
jgi:hypothetical protein